LTTARKPYLVQLKPEFAGAYKGKLEVGREYQALISLHHPNLMKIVGTEVSHAAKGHFTIKPPA
jgi:hypothetical protein